MTQETENALTREKRLLDKIDRLRQINAELVAALEGLFDHCEMVHKYWGDGDNTKAADNAIAQARDALERAKEQA